MTRLALCCVFALALASPSAAAEPARAPAMATWLRAEIPFVVAVVVPARPASAAVAAVQPVPAGISIDVDAQDTSLVVVSGAPEVQALVLRVAAAVAGQTGAVFVEGRLTAPAGDAPARVLPLPPVSASAEGGDVLTLCASQPLPRDPELLGVTGRVLTRLVAHGLAPLAAVVTLESDVAGVRLRACMPEAVPLAQITAGLAAVDARGDRTALITEARGATALEYARVGGWARAAARAFVATGRVLAPRDDSDDAVLLSRARARLLPWTWRATKVPAAG